MFLTLLQSQAGGTVDPPSSSTAGFSGLVWFFISLLLTVVSYGG